MRTPQTRTPLTRRVYGETIRDVSALEDMLKASDAEFREPARTLAGTSCFIVYARKDQESKTSYLAGSSPVQKFQPALKPAASPVVVERIEDGFLFKNAQATLDEWKIEPYLDHWTESMRKAC